MRSGRLDEPRDNDIRNVRHRGNRYSGLDARWDERGYAHDSSFNFDEYDDSLCDAFQNEALLDVGFCKDDTIMPNSPLFMGSSSTGKDLARYLLSLKATHLKMGDGVFSSMVGMVAQFLPAGNLLQRILKKHPSEYFLLKCIDNLAAFETQLRTIIVDVCINGCVVFYKENKDINFCPKCRACRWKLCLPSCFQNEECICNHRRTTKRRLYYNVVKDRLVKLLTSDLKNLMSYAKHLPGM
jgi:hypothetical protein